ncbi:MAG: ATP synthase F0 subunit B [SAR324 cluster bacterium]|nr:ATP synthase F0 subunit B [SAR324 cluster bacterium]
MKIKSFFLGTGLLTIIQSTIVFAAEEGGHAPSPLDFVWKVVNFVGLLIILHYFAKKPIVNALRSSSESAKKELEDARQAKEQIIQEMTAFRDKIANMQKETEAMVVRARADAEVEKNKIIADGVLVAQKIREHAQFTIQQEYKIAEQQLKEMVAQQFVELAETKIKNQITSTSHKNLVNQYVNHITQTGDHK